ncbi:hypothetical protein B0H13DRAFT_1861795 [Mycena leptocephala]|nr:hypothetical protein B0H13DRAFT_1861795 [Mycena leptocephala]
MYRKCSTFLPLSLTGRVESRDRAVGAIFQLQPVTQGKEVMDDSSMALLAREPPRSFRIPSEITTFLEETPEWHSRYALDVVTIIRRNDLNLPRANSISSSSTSSDSDSENSRDYSDSHKSNSDDDEIPAPTEDDQNTVIPSTSCIRPPPPPAPIAQNPLPSARLGHCDDPH